MALVWDSTKEWKVGDEVIVCTHHSKSLEKVKRVTNTQLVVGYHKFRKKDGWDVGGEGSLSRSWLTIPNENDIEQINIEKKRSYVIDEFRKKIIYRINELNNEQLDSIIKFVDEL